MSKAPYNIRAYKHQFGCFEAEYEFTDSEDDDYGYYVVDVDGVQVSGIMPRKDAITTAEQWNQSTGKPTYVQSTPKLPSLSEFLTSKAGHQLWDSPEVRLVLYGDIVFILVGNDEVVMDDLALIKNAEFTDVVDNYAVEGYATIAEVNYIFIRGGKL